MAVIGGFRSDLSITRNALVIGFPEGGGGTPDYFQRRYLFVSRLRKLSFVETKLRKDIISF